LIQGTVDTDKIEIFFKGLRIVSIAPAEVITDGSSLYPANLKKVWPTIAHHLCLFHETRHVTKAIMEAIQEMRRSLPIPPAPEK
jgi:transposase-like protein